jgi:hypothetical protein
VTASIFPQGLTMKKNIGVIVGMAAIAVVFGMFVLFLWMLGLFNYTGTDASTKIVTSVVALVGGVFSADWVGGERRESPGVSSRVSSAQPARRRCTGRHRCPCKLRPERFGPGRSDFLASSEMGKSW